jgi:predicted ATPase
MIVAYTGTHGTGKTTAVYTRAAMFKREYPDSEVGIVCETARLCPYPVLGQGSEWVRDVSQRWIFAAQQQAELSAAARYDIVVCDRTVCDCIAYTLAGGLEHLARSMMDLAQHHVDSYDHVYLRRMLPETPAADDGFRSRDETMRARVEECLIEIYHRLGVRLEG